MPFEGYQIQATKKPAVLGRSARRNEFTADDDKLLIEFLKEQYEKGAGLSGTKIYDAFAARVSSF